jgi:tetratricopeptide (TPR) repeat protein
LLDSLGTLEVELDDRQRGLFLLERALSIRRQAFGAKSGDVAWGLILLGNYYMRTEQPAQAEMKFREAWEISRTAGCGPECNRATPLTALADLLRQQGRQEEADAVVAQLDAELDKDARARRAKK